MLSIMGERERTHLVLQYVTMCIHVDWCLASFLSFLSSMGERERTHLVLQYVTMCIHVDWCLASFLSFLSSIVIMDMSQSLSI